MAIHKATHEKNYTVLDNDILRGKQLSATAKVVLAISLSLPDDWKFNIRGLCSFTKEGPDAVARAFKELEAAGYIERRRIRDRGRIVRMEYDIYEDPSLRLTRDTVLPDTEKQHLEKPDVDTPYPEAVQLPSTNLPSIDIPNIYDTKDLSTNQTEAMEETLRKQIEYDIMCQRYDPRLLDDLVSVMLSVMVTESETISVGKNTVYPTTYVRSCLGKINSLHIEQLMENLERTRPTIHNTRSYLLAALINTANTMDMGYQYTEI